MVIVGKGLLDPLTTFFSLPFQQMDWSFILKARTQGMQKMILPSSCYSLEAVAKRWNCDVRTLLLFACDRAFAIALPPEIDGKFYYVPNLRDFLQAKPDEKIEVVLVCATPEAARGIIRDDSGNIITDADLEAMPYEAKKEILRELGKATTLRLEDNRFTLMELVITYEELERFERENQSRVEVEQNYQNTTSSNTKPTRKVTRKPQRITDLGDFLYPIAEELERAIGKPPNWRELWKEIMFRARASKNTKELQDGTKRVLLDGEVIELAKGGDSITLYCANHCNVITGETIRNWHRKTYLQGKREVPGNSGQ